MSIKMTTQMDWMHHSSYSPNHPENMNKVGNLGLPSPVVGPPPVLSISEVEKKTQGAWGHTLCCERAYGPCETTTRIKGACTPQGHRYRFVFFSRGPPLCGVACSPRVAVARALSRLADSVTNKVGSNWSKTITVERGTSTMCSAMYSGSLLERSFSALANEGVGSLKR